MECEDAAPEYVSMLPGCECGCSGVVCAPVITDTCEVGTFCAQTDDGPDCFSKESGLCNGGDLRCPEGQFCEYAMGLCPRSPDEFGFCVDMVEPPCPDDSLAETECGCDGVVYDSTCHRHQAGVPLKHGPGLYCTESIISLE
ncbi:MAG: hypothetical protein KUG77_16645 [Nannocystaceae bacterium]|nr:hypothetical protein [Nannocystaceae bacterium]